MRDGKIKSSVTIKSWESSERRVDKVTTVELPRPLQRHDARPMHDYVNAWLRVTVEMVQATFAGRNIEDINLCGEPSWSQSGYCRLVLHG